MAKVSGLGDNLYVSGYDLSGDVGEVDEISGGPDLLEVTAINKSATERIGGLRDGHIKFKSFFNVVAGQEHAILSTLPRTDALVTYARGTTLGNPAACLIGKQIDYKAKRDKKGMLTFEVDADANAYGLEWGNQVTAGLDPSTSSVTGTSSTFETTVGSWVLEGNCTVARSTAQAHSGSASLALTSAASGDMSAFISVTHLAVTPGKAYLAQGWLRTAVSARNASVAIAWYTSGGSFVSLSETQVADTAVGWTLSSVLGVAPATAAFASPLVKVYSTGAANEVHYVDDVTLIPQPASVDFGTGSTTFGAQAYLQVTAFTGTDVTLKLQSSSDDAATDAFSDVTGGGFTAVTTGPAFERIATSTGATIERYLRVVATTSGGFSALTYNVVVVRNDTAPAF